MKQKTALYTTGGTIEKSYDPYTETLNFSEGSVFPKVLQRCNSVDLDLFLDEELRDSETFETKDFERILHKLEDIPNEKIVVIHGTSTMVNCAKFVKMNISSSKTIVFTGAFRPYRVSSCEASFNIGSAVVIAESHPKGVYIVMNGQVFNPENCIKNIESLRFEKLT